MSFQLVYIVLQVHLPRYDYQLLNCFSHEMYSVDSVGSIDFMHF